MYSALINAVARYDLRQSDLVVYAIDCGHYSSGQSLLWRAIVFAADYHLTFFEAGHSLVPLGFTPENVVSRTGLPECLLEIAEQAPTLA